MLVIVTEPAKGSLPKVIVTLAGSEIDALLGGSAERFPVGVGDTTYDVEMIAASTPTPTTPKPNVRLRVANDALGACRMGTVTPLFPDPIPFVLVLLCSDPPATKVRVGPNLVVERLDLRRSAPKPLPPRPPDAEELPLSMRVGIGLCVGVGFAVAGYFQGDDAPLYYLIGIGCALWSVFGKTNPRAR